MIAQAPSSLNLVYPTTPIHVFSTLALLEHHTLIHMNSGLDTN